MCPDVCFPRRTRRPHPRDTSRRDSRHCRQRNFLRHRSLQVARSCMCIRRRHRWVSQSISHIRMRGIRYRAFSGTRRASCGRSTARPCSRGAMCRMTDGADGREKESVSCRRSRTRAAWTVTTRTKERRMRKGVSGVRARAAGRGAGARLKEAGRAQHRRCRPARGRSIVAGACRPFQWKRGARVCR